MWQVRLSAGPSPSPGPVNKVECGLCPEGLKGKRRGDRRD